MTWPPAQAARDPAAGPPRNYRITNLPQTGAVKLFVTPRARRPYTVRNGSAPPVAPATSGIELPTQPVLPAKPVPGTLPAQPVLPGGAGPQPR